MRAERRKHTLAACAACAACATLTATDVPWQFTGATNRVAAATASVAAQKVPFAFAAKGAATAGGFESRTTHARSLVCGPFTSDSPGIMVILH